MRHAYWLNYRKVQDRPRDPAKWSEIADVAAALSIPVIANGDVFEYEDFQRIRDATGVLILLINVLVLTLFSDESICTFWVKFSLDVNRSECFVTTILSQYDKKLYVY